MGKYSEKNVKRIFIPSEEEILQKANELNVLLSDIKAELAQYHFDEHQLQKINDLISEIRQLQDEIRRNQTLTGEQKNKTMNEVRIHLKLWSSKLLMEEGKNSFLGLYIKNQMRKYLTDIETIGVGETVVHYCLSSKTVAIKNKEILLMRDLLKKAKQMSIKFENQLYSTDFISNRKSEKLNELYELMGRFSQIAINHLKLHDREIELFKFQLLNIYRNRISNNKKHYKIRASKQVYKENIPLNQILRECELFL